MIQNLTAQTAIRIARPCTNFEKTKQFYVQGLGLEMLYQHLSSEDTEWSIMMLGIKNATWHLEFTQHPQHDLQPAPTAEDLLVLYLAQPIEAMTVQHLIQNGGTRVKALNSYWETWGVTIADPDGYRVVLSTRDWAL